MTLQTRETFSTVLRSLTFSFLLISGLAAWNLGPLVGTPLRDVDTIAVDFYSRFPISDIWTMGHLRGERVHFYRPLSDFFDALMVRSFGFEPAAFHICLLVLIIINGVLLARWIERLCRGAGWLAGALYVVHPFQQGTLSYFEGGSAHVTYLFFALVFIHAMMRFREHREKAGGKRWFVMALISLFATTLCFDGALALPVGWFILDRLGLAPDQRRREQSLPWRIAMIPPLVLLPTLVLRKSMLGVFLGGYGTPGLALGELDRYAFAFARIIGRILYPGYPVWREEAWWGWSLSSGVVLSGFVLMGVLTVLLATKETRRRFLGLSLLLLGLLAPASPDFVLDVLHLGDLQPNGAYRLSVPFGLGAAWIAVGIFGGIGAKVRSVAILIGILLITQSVSLSRPMGALCEKAGEVAERVRENVISQIHQARKPPESVFLFGTPLEIRSGSLSIMRVYQYGLASAFRPPISEPGLPPVFPIHDGKQVLLEGTREAFCSRKDVLSLEADLQGQVVPFLGHADGAVSFSLSQPSSDTTLSREPPSESFLSLHRAQTGEPLDARELGFEVAWPLDLMLGSADPVWPVVIILNAVTPFIFERHVGRDYHLPLVVDREAGLVRGFVGGAYLDEIRGHAPEWPIYILVEGRDGGDRTRALFRSQPIRLVFDSKSSR